jgi:uncharacterized protein DUF4199
LSSGSGISKQSKLITMEAKKPNYGLTYGVILGLVMIIYTVILYLGGVKLFISPLAWVAWCIPIVVAVLGGLKQKKALGGYMSYGEALKTVFLICVIGSLISTIFSYVLFNIIDEPFRQALAQETAVIQEKMMRKFGASDALIEKSVADTLNGNSYTIGKIMLGYAFGLIFWFIVSLIIAAIIKKNKPEFQN